MGTGSISDAPSLAAHELFTRFLGYALDVSHGR
jgi:hypothetical protein